MKVLVNSCWAHFSEEKKRTLKQRNDKKKTSLKDKIFVTPSSFFKYLKPIIENVACQRGRCLLRENFCTLQLIIINTWIANKEQIYNDKPFNFFRSKHFALICFLIGPHGQQKCVHSRQNSTCFLSILKWYLV